MVRIFYISAFCSPASPAFAASSASPILSKSITDKPSPASPAFPASRRRPTAQLQYDCQGNKTTRQRGNKATRQQGNGTRTRQEDNTVANSKTLAGEGAFIPLFGAPQQKLGNFPSWPPSPFKAFHFFPFLSWFFACIWGPRNHHETTPRFGASLAAKPRHTILALVTAASVLPSHVAPAFSRHDLQWARGLVALAGQKGVAEGTSHRQVRRFPRLCRVLGRFGGRTGEFESLRRAVRWFLQCTRAFFW